MCLPLSKKVGRGAAAIQRDDQIVLIAGHDRMRKDASAPTTPQHYWRGISSIVAIEVLPAGAGVFLRSRARSDAGHQRGLGLAHMPLLVTQNVERPLRHFAFQLEQPLCLD